VFVVNVESNVSCLADPVELADCARVGVAALDEKSVVENTLDFTYCNAERVHEHIFELEEEVRLEEFALQHARVVLLLFNDLLLVLVEPLDDAEHTFACLFLCTLLNFFVQLAVEYQCSVVKIGW
jgi:hypothetical protein